MGTFGQDRTPQEDTRVRRNSQAWNADSTVIVDPNGGIIVNGDGSLSVDLGNGLAILAGEVAISLSATPGLEFSSGDLQVKHNPAKGLVVEAAGVGLNLDADPGVEFNSNALRVKIKADGGITRDGDGLSVAAATEANRGGVLRQTNIADVAALTDNSGGTDGSGTVDAIGIAITNPADTPADADALRDDLVANTIPSIETEVTNLRNAVATLAAYCTTLEDKINAMLAAQITATQMSTP